MGKQIDSNLYIYVINKMFLKERIQFKVDAYGLRFCLEDVLNTSGKGIWM